MLVTSLIPNRIRSQYQKLENLNYWQNLGNNQNFAVLCSIVHYFLNQKNYNTIQKFLNIDVKAISDDSHQILQLIIQSLVEKNPIQYFFKNLSQQQNYIEKIAQLLNEICKIHFLMKNEEPSLESIALFLQIEINFLHNNQKFGRGRQSILLLKKEDDLYFIIPLQYIQQLLLYQCILCKQSQHCINLNCNHQICINCIEIQKQNNGITFFFCQCGQIILKNQFLEDVIKETNNLQILNDHKLLITEYYKNLTNNFEIKMDNKNVESNQFKQQLQKRIDNYTYNQQNQLKQEIYPQENCQVRMISNYQGIPAQNNDFFQEEKSRTFDLMCQIDQINSQSLYQQSRELQQKQCSYCFAPFDDYNVQQDINCTKHFIGICCINADYKICPQCEKINELLQEIQSIQLQFQPEYMDSQTQYYYFLSDYSNQKSQEM